MFCLLLSQGNKKQRWLPCVDPLLPRHVLFLSSLPRLVWQLIHSYQHGLYATGSHQALAYVGYLINAWWKHWHLMHSWPSWIRWTSCSSWRLCLQVGMAVHFSLIVPINQRSFSGWKHFCGCELCVEHSVHFGVIVCNYSCLAGWKTDLISVGVIWNELNGLENTLYTCILSLQAHVFKWIINLFLSVT